MKTLTHDIHVHMPVLLWHQCRNVVLQQRPADVAWSL